MFISRAAGASLLAIACAATPAAAGELPAPGETIVVTGERPAESGVEERPGGADLITAEEFDDRLAVSLRDALAFSPGVYAQPRFGQEVRLSIRGSGIGRGFHMRGLTLLQDGVPINLADDNGDFQELDPLFLDRIEVVRGANALRYGGSTLGGAVNGITPNGRDRPGIAARIDGGSFDTMRGFVSGGFSSGVGDAWAGLAVDRSEGDREHARRRAVRFSGNVGLRLSERVETRFYASAQSLRQELPGALPLETVLTRPRTGNFAGDQARDIDSIRLQNRTSLLLGEARVEVAVFVNAKQLYHPIFQAVDQQSNDTGASALVDWASGPVELSAGATARFGTVDSRRYVNLNGQRGARTFAADQRARTIDAFAEGRYRLGALSLIAGGIFTHGEREQEQRFPVQVSGSAEFDRLSPRIGLLWEPSEEVQVYANYSASHELPGFVELAQVGSFVPLDAQRAWTAEVGARGRIGIARFDISLYRARVRGELLQFTVGPDIPASTFNADRTLHQGVEAGLDLDLTPWARLRQVYQYNDFRFVADAQYGDNRLPVIPRHLYRAELRLGTDDYHVAPHVEWVPEGAWADYANTLRVEGYALAGVTAEARVLPQLTLFADARNLTGEKAVGDVTAVVNYQSLTPAQRAIFYPVEPRAIFVGARMRF